MRQDVKRPDGNNYFAVVQSQTPWRGTSPYQTGADANSAGEAGAAANHAMSSQQDHQIQRLNKHAHIYFQWLSKRPESGIIKLLN